MGRSFRLKFSNFGTIFAATRYISKTSVKIAWHEPNDMPTSLATSLIVIRRLSNFSSVVDMIGRARQASSLTSSRPFLNRLYHNRTSVLGIVNQSNAAVNISIVLAHLISVFAQN